MNICCRRQLPPFSSSVVAGLAFEQHVDRELARSPSRGTPPPEDTTGQPQPQPHQQRHPHRQGQRRRQPQQQETPVVRLYKLYSRCSERYVRLTSSRVDALAMLDDNFSKYGADDLSNLEIVAYAFRRRFSHIYLHDYGRTIEQKKAK